MESELNDKIQVGISACMYGCPVRYNGKGRDITDFLGRERGNYIWHPVCPEVMAGMGVPRNPIRIVGGNGFDVWEGKARVKSSRGEDLTENLKNSCLSALEMLKNVGVYVYIFMDGSPSCGVYRTTLKNKRLGNPPGVFGALLLKEGFFLIPASHLQSPIKRWDWIRRLNAFVWVKNHNLDTKKDIYDMWHTIKFICQEIDNEKSRELGRVLAEIAMISLHL